MAANLACVTGHGQNGSGLSPAAAVGGTVQRIPDEIIAVANGQTADRYRDKPYGNLDWKMLTRRLARVDSSFMT